MLDLLIPLALILLGAALIAWHGQQWKHARELSDDAMERDFRGRQFRRRVQTSGLLVAIGVAMLGSHWVDRHQHPSAYVFYWLGIVLLVFWMLLLAVVDVVHTRMYTRRVVRSWQPLNESNHKSRH